MWVVVLFKLEVSVESVLKDDDNDKYEATIVKSFFLDKNGIWEKKIDEVLNDEIESLRLSIIESEHSVRISCFSKKTGIIRNAIASSIQIIN